MKRKILYGFLLGLLPFSAQALPVCQPYEVSAKYISRWQQNEAGTAWQAEFICEDRRQAKLHAEDVEDPSSNDGTFFIVDMNNILESQENFPEPCEAVSQYCSGTMTILSAEAKAMLAEQMNAAPAVAESQVAVEAVQTEPAVSESSDENKNNEAHPTAAAADPGEAKTSSNATAPVGDRATPDATGEEAPSAPPPEPLAEEMPPA